MMGLSRGTSCLPGWVPMARWDFASPLALWVVPWYLSWFPVRFVLAVRAGFVLCLGPECDQRYFRNSSSKTRLLSSALQKAFGCCFSRATTEHCRLFCLLLQMQVAFFGLLCSWRILWQHATKILLFGLRHAMDMSFPWREEESMDQRWQMLCIKQGDLSQCGWH